ncbi:MAG TPA: hypothetical protein VKT78_15020 [Fimbriimonadaceae bacterium]|nr:hypothetical protein [Fimbriimonadaceae bacterium]
MKARITAEMIVGRGVLLMSGEEVEVSIFGDYVDGLVRDSAIELLEPILAVADGAESGSSAQLI